MDAKRNGHGGNKQMDTPKMDTKWTRIASGLHETPFVSIFRKMDTEWTRIAFGVHETPFVSILKKATSILKWTRIFGRGLSKKAKKYVFAPGRGMVQS